MKRARHIKMTEREFKALKRQEFKELKEALDRFRLGCAYLPQEAAEMLMVGVMRTRLKSAHEILKKWWKNA